MKIIIVSPPYQKESEGIKVLHFLCHSLNVNGYLSKILFLDTSDHTFQKFITLSGAEGLNPEYSTESIKSVSEVSLESDVILYPEIISNNPANAKNVIRYFLNKPGNIFGNSITAGPRDLLVSYQRIFYPPANFSLYYPLIDLDKIPAREEIEAYSKNLMLSYIGKGKKYGECSRVPGSISLDWEKSYEEYIILLKNSRYIFTWDAMSGVNLDAIIYGSIPIVLSSRPWSHNEIYGQEVNTPLMTIEEFGQQTDVMNLFNSFLNKRDEFFTELDRLQKKWPEKIHAFVNLLELHFRK